MSQYVSWFPERGVFRADQVDFQVPHLNTHAVSTFVPLENLDAALEKIREVFRRHDYTPHLPVAVRFVKGDATSDLSPTGGKPCAVIEVFAEASFDRKTWEPTFQDVQQELEKLGGRPHWGKGFFGNPRSLYADSAWTDYERLRRRMDPDDKFLNAWAKPLVRRTSP
jgi:FAD/FMN-containing dehydrogenase